MARGGSLRLLNILNKLTSLSNRTKQITAKAVNLSRIQDNRDVLV